MTTVLIVEDDMQLGRLYGKTLKSSGFAITLTVNCEQTFAILETMTPDAILLDITLPDGNGLDVIRYLCQNARFAHTRILVLSGANHYEAHAQEQGVDYFLHKPVSTRMLPDLLNRLFAEAHATGTHAAVS